VFFELNPINVLLAALAAASAFALVMVLGYERPVNLSEMERVFGNGTPILTPIQSLQRELDAARFNISAGEFLRVSIVLAILCGLGGYVLTGALLASVLGLVLGGLSYWMYLAQKANKALETYEDELPQVVARLISGAKLGNSLVAASEHVASFGPLNCRDDWQYIAAQLRGGAGVEPVFKTISKRRGSQLLNTIFELLLVQQQRGVGLSEILPLIQESLEERTRTVRKARTKMKGPIRELWLVSAMPIIAVILFRLISPTFFRIYSTSTGQLFLLIGWGMTLGAFIFAHRSFSNDLRRETNFYGALPAAPRAALQSTASKPDASSSVSIGLPNEAPSALSGVMRTVGRTTGDRRQP
jgi:tight adherence protein B